MYILLVYIHLVHLILRTICAFFAHSVIDHQLGDFLAKANLIFLFPRPKGRGYYFYPANLHYDAREVAEPNLVKFVKGFISAKFKNHGGTETVP
ncbi:MAG: hypothetical protein K0Q79_76 [Flavipsychrobacter sp.]|jgi:hypothetical protein|nr:hypothetical protein [Flavipsychrobacter sp.]